MRSLVIWTPDQVMEDETGKNYSSEGRECKSIENFGRRLEGKATQVHVDVNGKY
jgi:hypothetical protein